MSPIESARIAIDNYEQRPEATGTYETPKHGWTCFFCGETFTTYGAARDHFGEQPTDLAACQIKVGEERGLVMELRRAQRAQAEWQLRALGAEAGEEGSIRIAADLRLGMKSYKPFSACWTMQDVFNVYDSMEGRALKAEESEAKLLALLNTPEVEDFDKAVPLEAAHQVLRWGAQHDAGKSPADWFWLIGYVAGKALAACLAADKVKAKHHAITVAAVARNWHAHIRAGESVMRPGISAEKTEGVEPRSEVQP